MAHRDTYNSFIKLNSDLDSNFGSMVYEVEQRMHILDRNHKVMVTLWMRKLALTQTTNPVPWFPLPPQPNSRLQFKRNRNAYARLLLEMLTRGRIEDPFDKKPPEGPLPQMPNWLVSSLTSPGRGRRPGSSSVPASPGATGAPDALRLNQTRAIFAKREQALDSYRGRTGGGGPLFPPRPGPPATLTRLDGRSQSARLRDRAPLEYGRSRTQVEAELGASRERNRELEFRMGVTEDRLRDRDLAYAREVGERTARRAVAETMGTAGVGTRSKLDDIIDRYERKKDAWSLPITGTELAARARFTSSRPTSLTSGVPPAPNADVFAAASSQILSDLDRELEALASGGAPREEAHVMEEDESAWLRSLEEFKRQTELLKQQIASIGPGRP